ncbi:hypothetical protein SAMN02745121_08257 [Nannocystis exedens]|uniref:Uncharacterized protein n=1 Tax=Nannocystis exedens TaxID=54 RepID=A0A1I2HW28_9BACT|nr:hypothetical protein [Nannocystis exedens]PCC72013.1 hypothetical protein NAEX_05092 [Nannocystis exedens]SFF34052.1 hypothetical protein SAMN02745121_08257 [Nannocystis exedens]
MKQYREKAHAYGLRTCLADPVPAPDLAPGCTTRAEIAPVPARGAELT